jgi:hypothetical protein
MISHSDQSESQAVDQSPRSTGVRQLISHPGQSESQAFDQTPRSTGESGSWSVTQVNRRVRQLISHSGQSESQPIDQSLQSLKFVGIQSFSYPASPRHWSGNRVIESAGKVSQSFRSGNDIFPSSSSVNTQTRTHRQRCRYLHFTSSRTSVTCDFVG